MTDLPVQYIVLQERSAGNESVGSEWIEAGSFPPTATLEQVYQWAFSHTQGSKGRLMITPDTNV